ncbi:MAG: DUF692 family multinuclear iron-containing protein [Chloroflexota bacterium]
MSYEVDRLPALGIGITYSSAVVPILQKVPELVDIIEFEPQTAWIETGRQDHPYKPIPDILDYIDAYPSHTLVHGIGTPVGGTVMPELTQIELLRKVIKRLNPPWFSDHLSFNQTGQFRTGFFLPPRQTVDGIAMSVRSIKYLQEMLEIPIAVETGVNYFKPREDELPDGYFVQRVVTEANCGILLDLHNILANQINGRQSVDDFLAMIPKERVWELHVAGGLEMDGFYLDAHSGAISNLLLDIVREVIPRLHNLKAIVYEIFPSFVQVAGVDRVTEQLEILQNLWTNHQRINVDTHNTVAIIEVNSSHSIGINLSPKEWEDSLGSLVTGQPPIDEKLIQDLVADPAIKLIQKLIHEFRASMIVRTMPYSARLMMLALGVDIFKAIMQKFWLIHPPHQYASTEARAFANFLQDINLRVPQLQKLLEYEVAIINTLIDGQARVVSFEFNPFPLLGALSQGRLPDTPSEIGLYEIELTPDTISQETLNDQQQSPFH